MVSNRVRRQKPTGREAVRREAFDHLPLVVFEGVEYPNFIGMADGYVEAVLTGAVIENQFVILACKRYKDMRKAAETVASAFFFSPAHAVEFCAFFERLPQLEGFKKPSGLLVAEPWQCWLFVNIFGFRQWRGHQNVRWIREVHLDVSRKQSKSTMSAAIDLYCFLYEDEGRSQILIGASTRDQANAVYGPIRAFLDAEPELIEQFGLKSTSKAIRRPDGGHISVISSIGRKNDGANPHVAHIDELHAVTTQLHEVMESSLGARPNQLFLKTTTAGETTWGPGPDARKRAIRVLSGQEQAPNLFTVIYTIDVEDQKDPLRWENVVKAMPNIGVSVSEDEIRNKLEQSKHNVFVRGEFITKQLNVYSDAARKAISQEAWKACGDPSLSLEDFRGKRCIIGADIGIADDHTALVLLFDDPDDTENPIIFCEHHIGSGNPGLEDERLAPQLLEWQQQGYLTIHDWPVVRISQVRNRILEFCELFDVHEIVFDTAQSVEIVSELVQAGKLAGRFKPSPAEATEPTRDIIDRANHKLLKHNNNPMLAWNVANVTISGGELIRVGKESTAPHMKIDGFSALMHANAARVGRVVAQKADVPEVVPEPRIRTLA